MNALLSTPRGAGSGSLAPQTIAGGQSPVDYAEIQLLVMARTHAVEHDVARVARRVLRWLRTVGLRPSRCVATPEGEVALYFLGTASRFAGLEFSAYGVAVLLSDRERNAREAWDIEATQHAVEGAARRILAYLEA